MLSLFWFFVALAVGSFVNVLVFRINEAVGGILIGRSKCPRCRKQIDWHDNIPLLSFVLLRGRCRHCRKPISWQYPFVELTSGLMWIVVWWVGVHGALPNWSNWINLTNLGWVGGYLWVVSVLTLLLALFVSDLRYMTLPEVFSAPLFLLVLGMTIWTNWTNWANLSNFGLTGVATAGFFFVLWAVTRGRGMGFGDVEYGLIMGLLLGFPAVLVGLMFAFLSGAVVGVGLMLAGAKKLSSRIPFGPFLILGTLFGWIWGERVVEWWMGAI